MSALQHVLGFDATGKLEKLCWPGFPNLLHECQQEVDLGGRRFRPAGWDECFPTIEPYGGSPVMGELVGVAPSLVCQPT